MAGFIGHRLFILCFGTFQALVVCKPSIVLLSMPVIRLVKRGQIQLFSLFIKTGAEPSSPPAFQNPIRP